jgi:hypothetical protein
MTGRDIGFKRMVVGLPQSMANRAAVEAAADLAEFLNIELLATFVSDATLLGLADLPAARELRLLDREWQAIDLTQIRRELEHATTVARRGFAESVKSRTIKTSFDVVGGAEAIAALIRADDIVAIIEPTHPGERITRQFTGLVAAAFDTAGAVLAVPRRIARTAGPVVAVAADPNDPSIRTGLSIAAAFKERLIVVTSGQPELPMEVRNDAEQLGVPMDHVTTGGGRNGFLLAPVPPPMAERLRVVTRNRVIDDARRLFSSLHDIPLLVIGPDRAELSAERDKAEGAIGG